MRARGVDDLAKITLLSDGTTVYECTSSEEVVDLLRGGQGVFGIAVSGALRELAGSLATLPSERTDGSTVSEEQHSRRRAVPAPAEAFGHSLIVTAGSTAVSWSGARARALVI